MLSSGNATDFIVIPKITYQRFTTLKIAVCMLILILSNHATHAIDLGNVIKNTLGGSNKNNKHENALSKQELMDASTGTITTVDPAQRKAETTCDGIMARAVVLANEEKSEAFEERDKAIGEMATAIAALEEIKAKAVKIEMNAKHMEKERDEALNKLEEGLKAVKHDAEERIASAEKNAKASVEKALKEKEDTVNEITKATDEKVALARKEADEEQKKARNLVDAAEKDAFSRIKVIQAMAEEEITAARSTAQKKEEDLTKEIQLREKEVSDNAIKRIEQAQVESSDKVKNIEAKIIQERNDHKAKISKLMEEEKQKIEALEIKKKSEIENLKEQYISEYDKLQSETSHDIEVLKEKIVEKEKDFQIQMKKEAEKSSITLKSVRAEKDSIIKSLEERYSIYEKDATDAAIKAKKDFQAKLKEQMNASTRTIESLKSQIASKEKIAKDTIAKNDGDAQNKINTVRAETQKIRESLEMQIAVRDDQISNLTAIQNELEYNIVSLKETVVEWETLHNSQSYVNVTLILDDTIIFLNTVTSRIGAESVEAWKIVSAKSMDMYHNILEATEPHRHELNVLYKRHLQKYVNECANHINQAKSHPLYLDKIEPFAKDLKIVMRKNLKLARKKLKAAKIHSIKSLKSVSENIAKKNNEEIPIFVKVLSEKVAKDPERYYDLVIKVSLFMVFFILRRKIFRFIIGVLSFPFRCIWFFCPLKFLLKSKSNSVPEDSYTDNEDEANEVHIKVEDNSNGTQAIKNEENLHTHGRGEAQ